MGHLNLPERIHQRPKEDSNPCFKFDKTIGVSLNGNKTSIKYFDELIGLAYFNDLITTKELIKYYGT